jgi:hypothetical protein
MGSVIQCFMLEPTEMAKVGLRRFRREAGACSASRGYCDAIADLGTAPIVRDAEGYWQVDKTLFTFPDESDPRWPTECEHCGVPFTAADHFQDWSEQLYTRSDTGEAMTLREAPPGAIWDASWYSRKGPDGKSLICKTPGGDWWIDGSASNGPGWDRTGVPPLLKVSPSIQCNDYHGYLGMDVPGQLKEC